MTLLPVIDACPKHMEYGPCGGVGFDGSCEIDATRRCAFLPRPTVPWAGVDRAVVPSPAPRTIAGEQTLAALGTRPWVVADLPARALSVPSIDACAAVLTGEVDAVLAGDAGSARVQFPPAYRAHLLQRRGLRVWTGLNMRDRKLSSCTSRYGRTHDHRPLGLDCSSRDHQRGDHTGDAWCHERLEERFPEKQAQAISRQGEARQRK